MRCLTLGVVLSTFVSAAHAQPAKGPDAATNPLSAAIYSQYVPLKGYIVKSADEMPDASYSFKPAPTVRSYGQLIGHLADSQYEFCAAAKGEKSPRENIEKTVTTKADLIKALNDAFTYCDGLYATLQDSKLPEKVAFFGGQQARLYIVTLNVAHNDEHYGNIVTYLRIKGLVPPSSMQM
jgi:uncharacterized damage-inducible protein DinB